MILTQFEAFSSTPEFQGNITRAPASPVGAFFSSRVALQIRHLVEFTQEFLSFIYHDGSHVIQVLPVELIEDAISRLRIGKPFHGLSLVHHL
jgi:hypothetical protein